MAKKVFISHSSKDKESVDLFKDLILKNGLGVRDEDIAYTSATETGVPLGGNISQYIKDNISSCDFVFFMISKNYKNSEVCLNEMGAAWALDKNIKPILLNNYPIETVGWLFDKNLCARINDSAYLDEIRDEFVGKYGFTTKTVVWNKYKNDFIEKIAEYATSASAGDTGSLNVKEEEVELGILDYRELFDSNIMGFISKLHIITSAFNNSAEKTRSINTELSEQSTKVLNPSQAKTIFWKYAKEMNNLSQVIEEELPALDNNFNGILENLLKMQEFPEIDDEIKQTNRKAFENVLPDINAAKEAVIDYRKKLKGLPKLEKVQISAKNRLLNKLTEFIKYLEDWYGRIRAKLDI